MLPLRGYFEGLFERIKPPKERRELAKTLPATVRDHLAKSGLLDTAPDEPRTRLAGSYGRKTGADDIKDVDIVVFVAKRYADEDPEVVLDDLAAALKDLEVEGYGKGEIKTRRKNRRSHHVEFRKDGEEAFHIDCVPVVRPGDDPATILRIPDREWERWDDTQPIGYGERLTELNQRFDEKVLPTIRMFRRIRNHHLRRALRRPKSYWLEAKVYAVWHGGRLDKTKSWADLIYDLMRAVRADCGPTPVAIADPCLGHNLTDNWEQAEYEEFVVMLDEVIGWLDEIADEADADAAVAAWRKVFGAEVFDLSEDTKGRVEEAKALGSTGAKITGAGTIVPLVDPSRGVPSPQHRFYGDR